MNPKMTIQYFATSFYNESQVNAYKTQICNPNGVYIVKSDTDSEIYFEFLIEPAHDHTLSANRIRLGSGYRKNYKIQANTSLKIEEYKDKIKDAKIIILDMETTSERMLREMKYVFIGMQVGNATIIDVKTDENNAKFCFKNEFYRITKETRFYVKDLSAISFDLKKQEKKLEKYIYAPLLHNDIFLEYNVNVNSEFFLIADYGMYPVQFVKKVCYNLYVNVLEFSFTNFNDDYSKIDSVYKRANEIKPCVILYTNLPAKKVDIDMLKKYKQKNESCYGIVSIFVSDDATQNKTITSTYEKNIVFELNLCDSDERKEIIEKIIKNMPINLTDAELNELVDETKGMTMLEISNIFEKLLKDKIYEQKSDEAGTQFEENVIYKLFEENKACNTKADNDKNEQNLKVNSKSIYADIIYGNKTDNICESVSKISLHAKKEIEITMADIRAFLVKNIITYKSENLEKPKYTFDDIGGYEDVKQTLREAVIWPINHKQVYNKLGLGIPKGIILHGPPGCAKTLLAKAISNESKMSFLNVKGSELESKWVGETTHAIHDLFKKARANSPCILFIDEIDAIVHKASDDDRAHHKKSIAAFLTAMDGLDEMKDVIVIGTTNRIDSIDKAFIRPGRIDKIIYVGLPDADARRKIFQIKLKEESINQKIVDATEEFSGAEITQVCQDSAMSVVRRIVQGSNDDKITEEDIFASLEKFKKKNKIQN